MKSSMSMDLALFSEKLASCRTLSIFLLMLKSAGTSCQGAHAFTPEVALQRHRKTRRPDSPRCGESSGFCSSFPEAAPPPWTWTADGNGYSRIRGLRRRRFRRESTHLNAALRVLFFLTKAILTRPSHSFQKEDQAC